MFDILILNGFIVSANSTIEADVAIKDGKIVGIGEYKQESAKKIINAAGNYILPGGIEAHMHCLAPFQGCIGPNDFYTQSISAAFGGVTMFMDFTNTKPGGSVFKEIGEREKEMKISAIDYSIHGKFLNCSQEIIDEIPKIIEYGVPTFKVFMTYKKEGVMCDDETIIKIFKKAKEFNGLPMLHCESDAIASLNNEENIKKGELKWKNFALAKPPLCEEEAFSRAGYLAKAVGTPILVVHTTTEGCLEIARLAKKNGQKIFVETGPHYLTIFDDLYDGEDGHLAICSPPLRKREDAENLWRGLSDGTIQLVGSDDCTYKREEKERFLKKDENGKLIQDYTKVVNGLSGLELRLPLLLSEGVNKKRLTINQVCALTSENAAKIYGCFPQKGIIQIGSDADITIVDLKKKMKISKDTLHNNSDFCLYEGMEITGAPVMTIASGDIIVEDNKFYGTKGKGRFIKRYLDKNLI